MVSKTEVDKYEQKALNKRNANGEGNIRKEMPFWKVASEQTFLIPPNTSLIVPTT